MEKILRHFFKNNFCPKIEKKKSNELWGNCGSVEIFSARVWVWSALCSADRAPHHIVVVLEA